MADHFHAVVWIDHAQARVFHFNVEEADKTVIRPDHAVRDIHHGEKRTGHRVADDRAFFEKVAEAIADAGAILIVGPARRRTNSRGFSPRSIRRSGRMSRGSRRPTIRPMASFSISPAASSKPPTECGRRRSSFAPHRASNDARLSTGYAGRRACPRA